MTIDAFLAQVNGKYRETAQALHALVSEHVGQHPVFLSSGNVVRYGKGSDDFMLVGLAVRSKGVMLYASADVLSNYGDVLGKKRTGKTCLRIRTLTDVDSKILAAIVKQSLSKKQMNYTG